MAATIQIHEWNGASPGVESSDLSNVNFGSNDSPNLTPATYPIIAGNNSFEKWLKMVFGGTFNKVDNLKIWKQSGTYKTEELIKTNAVTSGYTNATYPTGGPSQTTSTDAVNNIPTSEPASANLGIGGSLSGNLTGAGNSDFLVLQLQTTTNTEAGDVNQKVIRFQYDEQ